jgi:hypothetical protein
MVIIRVIIFLAALFLQWVIEQKSRVLLAHIKKPAK